MAEPPKATGDLMSDYLTEIRIQTTRIQDEIANTIAENPTEPRLFAQAIGRISGHMNQLERWLRDAELIMAQHHRARQRTRSQGNLYE